MYILESIQEFNRKKVGIYNLDKPTTRRIRRGEREFFKKGTPDYAIFISSKKIRKGEYDLYENISSFIQKTNTEDGCKKIETLTI